MANFNATILDSSLLLGKEAESHDGSYFSYRSNWISEKLERYQSDCKYFNNPGFVCPLSAYRPLGGLFFING